MDGIKDSAESRHFIDVSKLIIWIFGEFRINLHVSFPVKSPLLAVFLNSQFTVSIHYKWPFVQYQTQHYSSQTHLLWAAVGAASIKAQQAPVSVGAHQGTPRNQQFVGGTIIPSTADLWESDLHQNVTQTTWVMLKCW